MDDAKLPLIAALLENQARHMALPKQPGRIYVLCEPDDAEAVRYVGFSTQPELRLMGHIREATKRHLTHHRATWLRALLRRELLPLLRVIETVPDGTSWQARERYWIAYYRAAGAKLVNSTDGGEGVVNPSPDVRHRQGTGRRGMKDSLETKKKLSAVRKGRMQSPEHVAARVAARKKAGNYSPSQKVRDAISTKLTGQVLSEETRLKMSLAHVGIPHGDLPEATKKKIAASLTGRKQPAAVVAKRAASNRGKVRSAEACRHISEGRRGLTS